jgi:hypothetical protein
MNNSDNAWPPSYIFQFGCVILWLQLIVLNNVMCLSRCQLSFWFAGDEGELKVLSKADGERGKQVAPASYLAEEAVDQLQASEKLIAG